MGIVKVLRNPIWETISITNAWLINARGVDAGISVEQRAGINFSVLLNSACFVEGRLEYLLRQIIDARAAQFHSVPNPDFETRRSINMFFSRIVDELESRTCRATGPDNFGEMYELLTGGSLSTCTSDVTWEGIKVLFFLRNVIAHGRMAAAKHTMVGGTLKAPQWQEDFRGGYAKVSEYIMKRGLSCDKFGEVDVETLVFNDRVADHFWALAQTFIETVSKHESANLPRTHSPEPSGA